MAIPAASGQPLVGRLRSPSVPETVRARRARSGAADLERALDRVRRAPSIPVAIREARLVQQAVADATREGVGWKVLGPPLTSAIADVSDAVTAMAAIHGLTLVHDPEASVELGAILDADPPGLAAHAIWALASRRPEKPLIAPLAARLARGGMEGFQAQRTLATWAAVRPVEILAALDSALSCAAEAPARRRLVETVGLLDGDGAEDLLSALAWDGDEEPSVRRTAVAAFAERMDAPLPSRLVDLGASDGPIGAAVRLVRAQRRLSRCAGCDSRGSRSAVRLAQVHLGATLDATASSAGVGDAGGVATLLSGLGFALAAQPGITEVMTIGRAEADSTELVTEASGGHRFVSIPLESGEGIAFGPAWPAVVGARRGIRAALLADVLPDVIHLRIADPGSLAGAEVALELGIPIVFTLAPDPHGPVAAAERQGLLDRRTFGEADARSSLWYRMLLVDRLARQAQELVLFPRPALARQLRDLVGVDVAAEPRRSTVVAEGVDMHAADRARARVADGSAADSPAVRDLVARLASHPPERHGLPIVLSVGRLNEVKGMARLVEAFVRDAQLGASATLVIVGGDLERPSATEAAELARIRAILAAFPGSDERVVLLGHRPNAEVRLLLALARGGLEPDIGVGGAYACGSLKEEFGLAIVEALAAGLPVVAPREGGPMTYVEEGRTGVLVDTSDPGAIARGTRAALVLAADPTTARRARQSVEAGFTLDRMAATLADVYARVAADARVADEAEAQVAA